MDHNQQTWMVFLQPYKKKKIRKKCFYEDLQPQIEVTMDKVVTTGKVNITTTLHSEKRETNADQS